MISLRQMRTSILLFVLMQTMSGSLLAADVGVELVEGQSKYYQFYIRGEIKKGDAETLERLIRERLRIDTIGVVLLESQGGDAEEAARIGLVAQKYVLASEVGHAGCYSACFFIYISSPERLLTNHPIGVHRIYLRYSDANKLSAEDFRKHNQSLWLETERYLEGLQVTPEIIDLMRSTPSDQMSLLTYRQKQELGRFSPWAEEFLLVKCGVRFERGMTMEQVAPLIKCATRTFNEEQDRLLFE